MSRKKADQVVPVDPASPEPVVPVEESGGAEPDTISMSPEAEIADRMAKLPQPAEIIFVTPAPRALPSDIDIRKVRVAIDTLVSGCHTQKDREEAAKPALEILSAILGE